ncbi:MAG: aromatic amino acid ammonia-lyase [Acidilobus sp.]
MVFLCRGRRLSLEEICSAAVGERVEVCRESYDSLVAARTIYQKAVKGGEVYGYVSGLGAMADVKTGAWPGRERKVLEEHDTSVGPSAAREIVRAALVVRASQIAQGAAPVRSIVLERLVAALNSDLTPAVGLQGSVGASGDLAPLARIMRCLLYGEGVALVGGREVGCLEAVDSMGGTIELEPGEALALINSNAWSVGIASLGLCIGLRLVRASLEVVRRALLVTGCNPQHFSDAVADAKGQGAKYVIESLASPCSRSPRLQDPYSIRCIPQVYGAAIEVLWAARDLLEREASSPSENPFIWGQGVYHACNFHAMPAALSADMAKVALAAVGNSVERRTAQLLRSSITGLQEFLAASGSVVGAMIYQYTAASLSARLRALASPSSVHSIPTSGLQEDQVSMAPNAALDLVSAGASLLRLVAIESALVKVAGAVVSGGQLPDPRDNINSSINEVLELSDLGRLSGLLKALW